MSKLETSMLKIDESTGKEIFTNRVIDTDAMRLIPCLAIASIKIGIDRIERAIKSTYTKDNATMIMSGINDFMKFYIN
jgi:hypothetical protein